MNKFILFFSCLLAGLHCYAQLTPFAEGVKKNSLPVIYLPENVSVQFISPEPIQYVDISAKSVIGDLPLKNVLRIRLKDSVNTADVVITVAGEKFITQYHVIRVDSITARDARTEIAIDPADTQPLDISGIGLSQNQLRQLSLNLFCKRPGKAIEKTKAFDLKASLYHVYTAGDYVFIDLGYRNKTNLAYDVADLRFHIDDKKITKATNVQSVELRPEFILFNNPLFQKTYRNIIVLKKLTFPGNKILHIELSEKQFSGRVITLNITYQDVLDADTIPHLMNPLKNLEPDERERYDYLQDVFEEEFEQTHLAFHISGILVYELLNLLAACKFLFDEFGFPESEDSRLLRYAVTGTIAEYLEGGDDHGF